jgi:phosphate transport system substrate-binding protein
MGFTAALTSFSVILGIAAVVGAALAYLLGHDPTDPRRHLKRRLTAVGALIAFIVVITSQYLSAPQDSLLPYVPGVPFPGSTLNACQVTANDLPHASTIQDHAVPKTDTDIAGLTLKIGGGSVFTNFLADPAIRFDSRNGTHTIITVSNSGEGFDDLSNHVVDIAVADRFVPHKQEYVNFVDHQLGVIVFAVVVSADIGGVVHNLTTNQLKDIFTGKVTNWHEVGGPNLPIAVLNRLPTSGTRQTFEQFILGGVVENTAIGTQAETTQDIIDGFARTKGAISYISTASLTPNNQNALFPVCLDSYPPTEASVDSGKYLYWDIEHAYTYPLPAKPSATRDFLNFICSDKFKSLDLHGGGFLQMPQLSQAALATHPNYTFDECSSTVP